MREEHESKNKTNVYKKIHNVMNEMGTIKKNGYNNFHKYKYATEADYVEALRPLLKKHGLAVTFNITGQPSVIGPDESSQYLTTILVEFKLTCIDTKETVSCIVGGSGADKGDKGMYKALTGAKKYWAALTFLIETGDDPERDDKNSFKSTKKKKRVTSDDEF